MGSQVQQAYDASSVPQSMWRFSYLYLKIEGVVLIRKIEKLSVYCYCDIHLIINLVPNIADHRVKPMGIRQHIPPRKTISGYSEISEGMSDSENDMESDEEIESELPIDVADFPPCFQLEGLMDVYCQIRENLGKLQSSSEDSSYL
jgi:hypothetical protein